MFKTIMGFVLQIVGLFIGLFAFVYVAGIVRSTINLGVAIAIFIIIIGVIAFNAFTSGN